MSQNVLTLFPSRIAIGKWRDPTTSRDVPVLMTPEFERALSGLFIRVGGDVAMPNNDLETSLAMQPVETGALKTAQQIGDLQREITQLRGQLATTSETAKRVEQLERLLSTPGAAAELAKRIESVERAERSGAQAAQAETSKRVAALEQTERASLAAALAETKKRLDDLERLTANVPKPTDWDHPGALGYRTPNTASFTSVTISGVLTSSGGAQLIGTSTNLNNGAGASAGTLTNAPAAGNPTKWIPINDNGTTRYVPSW